MSNVKRLLILGIAAGLAFSVVGNTAAGFNLGKVLNKVGVSTTESSEEPLYEGEPADGTRENGMVYNAEVHGWYDEKTGALLSRNDAEARRMPAPPGPTTAKCDLIYGIVKARFSLGWRNRRKGRNKYHTSGGMQKRCSL